MQHTYAAMLCSTGCMMPRASCGSVEREMGAGGCSSKRLRSDWRWCRTMNYYYSIVWWWLGCFLPSYKTCQNPHPCGAPASNIHGKREGTGSGEGQHANVFFFGFLGARYFVWEIVKKGTASIWPLFSASGNNSSVQLRTLNSAMQIKGTVRTQSKDCTRVYLGRKLFHLDVF